MKWGVSIAPALRGPNWELPFHINTNAPDIVVGVFLGQLEDKKPYVIYYISKNLTSTELNYTMSEKEFLAVMHAVNKFWHYITGYQVFVHNNHSTIRCLLNKLITIGKIKCWLLLLQEFDITIVDKRRKGNVVVDFICRLTIEYLIAISTY